jgi:osmotically-inducible protein OsmY
VNQIVYLKGAVGTNDDLNRLQDMVLNTRGVMGISSEVVVREGEMGTPT